mmetsp:Transcript_3923/g.9823  ORF Transcript_3923/g.9823 Transcript_3923/m.9823 type:complete len:519 (-) Transcript_3923:236-1792(-)
MRIGLSQSLFWIMLGKWKFPTDLDAEDPYLWEFGWMVFLHSTWVLLLGMATISLTFFGFSYYRAPKIPKPRTTLPGKIQRTLSQEASDVGERMLEMMDVTPGSSLVTCHESRKKFQDKPSFWPLLYTAVVVVAVSYSGMYVRELNWDATIEHTLSAIDRFHDNAVVLRKEAAVVQKTCQNLNNTLQEMDVECSHDLVMSKLSDSAQGAFVKYMKSVNQINELLGSLPGLAKEVKRTIVRHSNLAFYAPLVPVLTVAVVSIVVVAEAFIITQFGGLKWAVRLDKTFKCGSIFFAFMIMFVACFACAGIMAAMALSSFCHDVDANVIHMVENRVHGTNLTDVLDFTRYYLTGSGIMNPVMVYIKKARLYIDEILDVYLQFEGVVQSFYPTCSPLEDIKVRRIAKEARQVLQACSDLLEPSNVYPYYEEVVRGGVCQEVMHSLANFPMFTLFLGCVIFPYCAVMAHRYVVHWSYWKHTQHGFVVDPKYAAGTDVDSEENSEFEDSESESDGPPDNSTLRSR